MSEHELSALLTLREDEHVEFKAAHNSYSADDLRKYACAFINEGGGKLILGVDDKTRQVVGTAAFRDLIDKRQRLFELFRERIDAQEVNHPNGRVIVFSFPPRQPGRPVALDGVYWMRAGEALVPMTPQRLKTLFEETDGFTDEVCPEAMVADLAPEAVALFRAGVIKRTEKQANKDRYAALSVEQLLRDTGLMTRKGGLTRAAVLLLGSEEALREWCPNAEVTIEYRQGETKIRYDRRENIRRAILLALEEVWDFIRPYNLPAIEFQQQDIVTSLPRYPERSVRESILNAFVHRDYRHVESIRIRIDPEKLEVTSPGLFPGAITPANVAEEQLRRNRTLAEALEKCGRIERSGQGVDLMIAAAVAQAQPLPLFEERDQSDVRVTLFAPVDQALFLALIQTVEPAVWDELSVAALRVVDQLRQRLRLPNDLHLLLANSFDSVGIAELIARQIISLDPSGAVFPRMSAGALVSSDVASDASTLSRFELKLAIRHQLLFKQQVGGMQLRDLQQVFPKLRIGQLRSLLQEMKTRDKTVVSSGVGRGGRWFVLDEGQVGKQLKLDYEH